MVVIRNLYCQCKYQGRRHGVDMCTLLLPEAILEIDANLVSLVGGAGVGRGE